ncbi:MAG: DUF2378 family protein [Myxococcota bacterium]
MGRPPDAVQTIPRRTVEALFHAEGIALTEPMRIELLALGVDLQALGPSYPLPLFRKLLDVARRHAFADVPEAAGFRAVGRKWVAGFKHTPIGWVFRAMAPVFGADRTIQTLPRYLSSVREDMPLAVVATGERRYQLTSPDASANVHFLAGCLEAVLETCGSATGQVAVTSTGPEGFVIDISWT